LSALVHRTGNPIGRLDLLALVLVQSENYFDLEIDFLGALSPINPGIPCSDNALVNVSNYLGYRFRKLG
jgi:hypothetical protein